MFASVGVIYIFRICVLGGYFGLVYLMGWLGCIGLFDFCGFDLCLYVCRLWCLMYLQDWWFC